MKHTKYKSLRARALSAEITLRCANASPLIRKVCAFGKGITLTQNTAILLAALFLMLLTNFTFFSRVIDLYPIKNNTLFLISIFVSFTCANAILISFFCYQRTIKFALILIFNLTALTAYFIDSYAIIFNVEMIDNLLETNSSEALDLLNLQQVFYVLLLGGIPSIFIYRIKITRYQFFKSVYLRAALLTVLSSVCVGIVWGMSDYYASFLRENKSVRYYLNPGYYLFSTIKYVADLYPDQPIEFIQIGTDAKIPHDTHRELIIFVLGETARADRFSLNGYARETNPKMQQLEVINFSNVESCATSTTKSVPCMFSHYTRENYHRKTVKNTENALDVLARSGVNVLWLDNNSSSKGVADRVTYEHYSKPDNNPICDTECRDEGMLANLQDYIDAHPSGDIFIVLHQQGNHGPAYYKRYPKQFEKFTPVCKTNQLEKCNKIEIDNAYDNAILYTDYFLAKTIALLQKNTLKFKAGMVYVSDHGESLGEGGIYLHGLPYAIAPKAQTHVPLLMWFSQNFDGIELDKLTAKQHIKLSHDYIFHTILGLFEIQSEVYDAKLDIIAP